MGLIHTVTGSVDSGDLGPVLPHEHLPLHFLAQEDDEFEPGSKQIVKSWYEGIFDELLKTQFRTMVACIPIGHGRDVEFRKELIGDRPINVIMATGFYKDDKQPKWAREKSADECTDLMVSEIEEGIGDSGVRAGIIKLAPTASSGQSRKVCRAGVNASLQTGARITTHSAGCSRESFDLLTEFGAAPENIYIGHADFADHDENADICRRGGNLLFTVWDVEYMIPERLMYRRFADLIEAGYTDNLLMSVDFAIMVQNGKRPTYLSWTLYGVEGRTHAYLATTVIPVLRKDYGVSEEDLYTITVENPRRMLDFRGN